MVAPGRTLCSVGLSTPVECVPLQPTRTRTLHAELTAAHSALRTACTPGRRQAGSNQPLVNMRAFQSEINVSPRCSGVHACVSIQLLGQELIMTR